MNDKRPSSTSASPVAAEQNRRRNSWIVWLWFWMTVGLVAIVQIPKEITAWKYAEALQAREAGNKERGYQLLEEAIKRNTDKQWYEEVKFRWLSTDERYAEALALLDSFRGTSGLERSERSQLLLHLKRFPEAIRICETLRDESRARGESRLTGVPDLPNALNNLAYARALGKIDLKQAANDMDIAVNTTKAELEDALVQLKSGQLMPLTALSTSQEAEKWEQFLPMVLDTRGFVHYQMDHARSAEKDLNQAVQLTEPAVLRLQKNKALIAKSRRFARDADRIVQAQQHMLAVLIYHRGLNRVKLGREDEAKQDFDRVRELIGKEPDDSLF